MYPGLPIIQGSPDGLNRTDGSRWWEIFRVCLLSVSGRVDPRAFSSLSNKFYGVYFKHVGLLNEITSTCPTWRNKIFISQRETGSISDIFLDWKLVLSNVCGCNQSKLVLCRHISVNHTTILWWKHTLYFVWEGLWYDNMCNSMYNIIYNIIYYV